MEITLSPHHPISPSSYLLHMSPFLEFRDVSYSYPQQNGYAVRDIGFSVNHGEFLGILGADDSGKSTITKLANGILPPSQGQVFVAGSAVEQNESLYALRQKVGVVFADPENQIVGTTVEEDVAFGLGNLCVPSDEMRKRVDTYLERVGLLQYATRSPYELSGGEQQKLCIAGVLAMEPECLLLDDPLTFLDSTSQQDILELIVELNASGMTVIYLTSDPDELIHAERIVVLKDGAILTECPSITLWNDLTILEQAGIVPSDMMLFRDTLRKRGYPIRDDSRTPEEIVHLLCPTQENTIRTKYT
jgi:energy-coupling factor transport system ATP-binding protein